MIDGKPGYLSIEARGEFNANAPLVFLGEENDVSYFAIDVAGDTATAPFADIGEYMNARAAVAIMDRASTAIFGHGRWLLEWIRANPHCAGCGAKAEFAIAGAKQVCNVCGKQTFPRVAPVAIVLSIHEGACLLGRGVNFPEGVLSALAGFIEAAETPEEAARREVFEEAGVHLGDVHYQFSQPWPFPNSLMMGFLADAKARDINLDTDEIAEARWVEKADIAAIINGETRDFYIPPPFTIARQLMERWVAQS